MGVSGPSVSSIGWRVRTLCGPRSSSQVLARFAFRHAMLYDSAEVSGPLAVNAPLRVAFPEFRPGRLPHYTLTQRNRFTPMGYGLDMFTLSPTAHAVRAKTRFSAEG